MHQQADMYEDLVQIAEHAVAHFRLWDATAKACSPQRARSSHPSGLSLLAVHVYCITLQTSLRLAEIFEFSLIVLALACSASEVGHANA